jgi:hypothetical protein
MINIPVTLHPDISTSSKMMKISLLPLFIVAMASNRVNAGSCLGDFIQSSDSCALLPFMCAWYSDCYYDEDVGCGLRPCSDFDADEVACIEKNCTYSVIDRTAEPSTASTAEPSTAEPSSLEEEEEEEGLESTSDNGGLPQGVSEEQVDPTSSPPEWSVTDPFPRNLIAFAVLHRRNLFAMK